MMGIYWHLKRQWQGISLIASLHWSALPATNFMQFESIFQIAEKSYSYAWLWWKRFLPGIDFICCSIICINNQICNINWLALPLLGWRQASFLIIHSENHWQPQHWQYCDGFRRESGSGLKSSSLHLSNIYNCAIPYGDLKILILHFAEIATCL